MTTVGLIEIVSGRERCLLSCFLVIRGVISVVIGAAAVDNALLKVLLLLLGQIVRVLEACRVLIVVLFFLSSERIVVILSNFVVFASARWLFDTRCFESHL